MRLQLACLTILIGFIVATATQQNCSADIIEFIVTGAAGDGLLEGNIDPPTGEAGTCLLYTSPSPRDRQKSRMPSSA